MIMKKLASLILAFVFVPSVFAAPSTMNVINSTTNFTLYFNLIAKKTGDCYPQVRDYYPSSVMSGYCDLAAGNSISFDNYTDLSSYYPGLQCIIQTSAGGPPSALQNPSIGDNVMNGVGMEWAYIISKVENSSGTITEGEPLSFSDFASCDGLPDSWYQTNTIAITYFTIGTSRYFVAA